MSLRQARIHLQQARQEATHGATANNAFIDLMVDNALVLLSAYLEPKETLVDDTDYNREAPDEDVVGGNAGWR